MSCMVHPKASLLSHKTLTKFSSSTSYKPVTIATDNEMGVKKKYFKLEGRGFNSNTKGSLIKGLGFGP